MKIRIDKLEGSSMGQIINHKLVIGDVYESELIDGTHYRANDGYNDWWIDPADVTVIEEAQPLSLYVLSILRPNGDKRINVLLTAVSEEQAREKATEDWGYPGNTIGYCEFVCISDTEVNKVL